MGERIGLILRRKPTSRLLWSLVVVFNGLVLASVLVAWQYPLSLWVRNTLFSEVLDDGQITTEAALNGVLAKRQRRDPAQSNPRRIFSADDLARLDRLREASRAGQCQVATDHPSVRLDPADCLARALAEDVSAFQMGGRCGLDGSLQARIGQVKDGVGCCSDFNEAYLLRAQAVGLEAREVNNLGHTTAEYFNPEQGRWIWIDTSNRIQISDADGELVSAWQLWQREPWRNLRLIKLPPNVATNEQDLLTNPAFMNKNNSVLYWTNGSNFQELERIEAPLRQLGLPREIVQFVSLALGIRPGWTVLATGETAFRMRLSAWLLKGMLQLVVVTNLMLVLAAMGWRLTRNRAYC
ncbi:MAG: hypothetical protein WCF98_09500 [Synechococcus sp. ELA057]